MTVDLPSVSSSKDCNVEHSTEVVLSRSSHAMDLEANDRMQPLPESVLEEYVASLLYEEA
ncbi:hypothetical protein KY284_033280 [Solanum tuberosum]|nr:hypothetical protein KY284_033280 [Solanum tuberosum]